MPPLPKFARKRLDRNARVVWEALSVAPFTTARPRASSRQTYTGRVAVSRSVTRVGAGGRFLALRAGFLLLALVAAGVGVAVATGTPPSSSLAGQITPSTQSAPSSATTPSTPTIHGPM